MEAGTTTESWGRAHAAVAVALFLCLFAAQAGLIVLTPVLSKVADDLDVSTATAGQLRMVSGLTAGLAAIALGTFARRLSLRRTILVGAAGLALASVASATAPTFVVLALAQMLLGAVCRRAPDRRDRGRGRVGSAGSIARVSSPGPSWALLRPGSSACR